MLREVYFVVTVVILAAMRVLVVGMVVTSVGLEVAEDMIEGIEMAVRLRLLIPYKIRS